ncbi:MAG: hypothetical protein HY079_02240 [Elusimicrobia bacterium]|nr:hypothetical protein [Elusimicrobiota bacterium]
MRTVLAVLLAALAAAPVRARGDGRPDDDRRAWRGVRRAAPSVAPSVAPSIAPTVAPAVAPTAPVGPHRGERFVAPAAREQRVEIVPRRYYWHQSSGSRYCHYYDGRRHWYGFYAGPAFYWTRYYDDRWWWWDARFGRWVYWWDGYWWWRGPGGAVYVYIDDSYYPYGWSAAAVYSGPPPSAAEGASYVSPDGRRLVEVVGPDGRAFLYDRAGSAPVYLKPLAAGVAMVTFRGGRDGAPLGILLEFKEKSRGFALFDADGDPLDAAAEAAKRPPSPPADAPAELPPPPTSAPGR